MCDYWDIKYNIFYDRVNYENMSIEDHMKMYEDKGIDRKEAMKLVAKDRGVSKRDIYNALLE